MSKRRIWIGDLAVHNSGGYKGEWIELPVDEKDLKDFVFDEVLEESHEEWYIGDYENLPAFDISRYSNIYDINDKVAEITILQDRLNLDDEVVALMLNDLGFEETISTLEEQTFMLIWEPEHLNFDKEGDLAYELHEQGLLSLEVNEKAKSYIDWAKVQRKVEIESCLLFGKGFVIELY